MEREKNNKLPPCVPVDEKDKRLVRVKERVHEHACYSLNELPPYVRSDEKDNRLIRVKERVREISKYSSSKHDDHSTRTIGPQKKLEKNSDK